MITQFLKPAIAAVAALTLASVGSAQVYKQQSIKTMGTLTHWTEDYDDILDSAVDSAGNRYMVGLKQIGSTVDSYIVKVTKKGFLSFYQPIPNYYASSIAVDGTGNIYVAGTDVSNNTGALIKFDGSGTMQWEMDTPYYSGLYDVAVRPDGVPVTAGSTDFGFGYYNGTMFYWDPNGVSSPSYWYIVESSSLSSLAVRPSDGAIILAGDHYEDATGINYGVFMSVKGDFSAANLTSFTAGQYGEYFSKVTMDPVTGVGVAMGLIYADDGGYYKPVLASCYAADVSGTWTTVGNNYPFGIWPDNGYPNDIRAGTDGNMYFAATNGYGTATPERAKLCGFYADPSSPSTLYANFYAEVPATDTGTFDKSVAVSPTSDGAALMVQSDLTIGLGSSAYTGFQVFTFGVYGQPIDRKVMGTATIDPLISTGPNTGASGMETAGGYLTLYGYTPAPHGFVLTAKLNDGPDDVYRTDEDTPLTVGLAKSVLNNDGNQFLLDPLTAQIQGSSISAGIHSLTLNSDGTFSATFEPNFNGQAKFKYKLKQNGVVIATNQVKINVKPKNDAPTAVNDSFNVAMNSAVQNLNVLGNDSDIDGDDITIFSKTNNANATIGITPDKKFITFKPKNGFSGDLTFTYTIRDPQGLQSTATVSVHVS